MSPAGTSGGAALTWSGVHAQVFSAAELSIGRRVAGATRADLHRALWEERGLVKTFGPRGTVHLLPTADLPLWTGALSALSSSSAQASSAQPSSVPQHPDGSGLPPTRPNGCSRPSVTRSLTQS